MAIEGRALTCQELVELVTEYLEGALSPLDRARFDEHLSSCAGCQSHLQQMGVTIAALGKLKEDSISPEALEELLRAFRNWKV